jgi:hypothetical protein
LNWRTHRWDPQRLFWRLALQGRKWGSFLMNWIPFKISFAVRAGRTIIFPKTQLYHYGFYLYLKRPISVDYTLDAFKPISLGVIQPGWTRLFSFANRPFFTCGLEGTHPLRLRYMYRAQEWVTRTIHYKIDRETKEVHIQ